MTVNPVPSTAADKTAANKTAVDDKTAINKTVDSAAQSGRIMCCYVNKTAKIQVVRIANIPDYFFERVVFAGQQLLIDVDSEAVLEIHSHELASAIVSDRFFGQRSSRMVS